MKNLREFLLNGTQLLIALIFLGLGLLFGYDIGKQAQQAETTEIVIGGRCEQ